MGEKERGLLDKPSSETSSVVTVTPAAARQPQTLTPKTTLVVQPPVLVPKTVGVRPRKGRAVSTTGAGDGSRGWATNWREVVWEKWRWGVLIALAVIVSRITTSA
jgi:ubiquitin-conjugating enzyme E2 J2